VDLLFVHNQTKKDRRGPGISTCSLKLYGIDGILSYQSRYELEYSRYGSKKHITFEHGLTICLDSGDIYMSYRIINDNLTEENIYRTSYKQKKNDFKSINDLIESGLYRGEKRLNYWGVKYERAVSEITLIITNKIKSYINYSFLNEKSYKEKPSINELFDLLVDFHLYKKNIKGHDNVYYDIMHVYPLKKYLKINDNKFLPSVLDGLKIKSKFIVKELNCSEQPIDIPSLNYLCKLFGDNYLDYIKKIDWKRYCGEVTQTKFKIETLKDDTEKNSFVKLINNWNITSTNLETLFVGIDKLLKLRRDLNARGVKISLTPKNDNQYNGLIEKLTNLKHYYKRGHKVRINYPNNFITEMENDIIVNDLIFKVKLLKTEEDYINEGIFMKNCMSKQFSNGLLYIYMRGSIGNKHINLQYRKGQLVQSYGKSNTKVPSIFLPFINLLNEKMKKFNDLKWSKEKYDYIIH
jgi:hypothetical protein